MIRRILVALDDTPSSRLAAEAAAELAALIQAEVRGLFVEDVELLRVCESPLGRGVDLLTAALERPRSRDIERQLRLQAERAKRDLRQAAERAGITWSFRVARGKIAATIADAAEETDVVTLGHRGWSLRRRLRLGTTARALLARPRGRALLLGPQSRIHPPILALFDGSEASRHALEVARQLTEPAARSLEVLLLGGDEAALAAEVAAILGEGARTKALPRGAEGRRLVQEIVRRGAGLLILPRKIAGDRGDVLDELLESVDCPALVVS